MTNYSDEDIKKGWQKPNIANTYDRKRFSSISGKLSDWLDKRALKRSLSYISKGSKILDMPVGTGRMSHYMLTLGYYNITCADISEDMIVVASNLLNSIRKINYIITDAADTSFTNGAFEAIISIRFMGHIPKEIRINILKEMSRICYGTIIIEYPITNPIAQLIKKIFKSLTVKNVLPRKWKWHYLILDDAKMEVNKAGLVTNRIIRKFFVFSESAYFSLSPRPIHTVETQSEARQRKIK